MLSAKLHRYIYLFGVYSMLFGIMLGGVPASVPIVILAANFLLELNYVQKIKAFSGNKLTWVLIAPFILSLVGLCYTSDSAWGSNIMRINLPLLIVPIVMLGSAPLNEKEFNAGLAAFLLGCFVNTAWCLLYSFVLHQNEAFRDASRFMNHIRLGLFINMAIAVSLYFFTKTSSGLLKLALLSLAFYFIVTLFVLGLASGLVYMFVIFCCALIYLVYKQNNLVKLIASLVIAAVAGITGYYILKVKNKQLHLANTTYNQVKAINKSGRRHIHFNNHKQKENGNYIYINIQIDGLKNAWNKRVPQDTFSFDSGHNLMRYNVLLRYLSSKSLTKDEEGVMALTNEDIENIRKNVPNYEYTNWNYLQKRVYEFVNEYDDFINHRDINGHSITMRFYYWRASLMLIQSNLWFGIGTGDLQQELNELYSRHFPELSTDWYKHPHNQFLSITACFGLFGLAIFLLTLIYPFVVLKNKLSPLYAVFYSLLILSFLTEDTLESQAGIGFYVIFNTLFCAMAWFKRQQTPEG